MNEFGRSKFTQLCPVVSEDVDKAWRIYTEAIEAAKQRRVDSTQIHQAPASMAVSQSARSLLASQQQPQFPLLQNQPMDHKRSWFDRLFRRK